MDNDRIEAYGQSYLITLPADSPVRDEQHAAEGWGDSPQMADELGALIAAGTKTATCSALWEYEAEGSPLPESGSQTIVLDGNENPLCIVETIEVEMRPYNEVDATGLPTKREKGIVRWSTGERLTGAFSHAHCRI